MHKSPLAGIPITQLNFDKMTCSEAVAILERLVEKLSDEPPEDRNTFKEIYRNEIRRTIQHIETCQRRKPRSKYVDILDLDFKSALVAFSPNPISVGSEPSVFRQEYRFFVGGLRIYSEKIRAAILEKRAVIA